MLYRFGDFGLSPERYELIRGGTRVPLEPRVLEVLTYLVANRERVVSKVELLDRLWGDVVVTEFALTRTIREVRRALGAPAGRSWIRTVYGRGFQFVGPVTIPEPAEPATRALPVPTGLPSVAVLPFADLSPAADQRHFCEGLADELISALTSIDGLSVASRTSSFQHGGAGADVRLIGARLHVATVLEGSVRRDGDRLRISAQLIDVANDRHLWAAVFEREPYQVFAIQIEIAESIVRALRVVLTDRERQALRRVRRVEIGAYDWYLRGRHLSAQASGRNLEAGRQMFLRAIELDPDFVPALAGLADCCAWLYLCWGERERELTTADEASRRAVALAPDSADAHAVRAMAYYLTGRPEEMDTEHLQEALDAGYRHCEWIVCEPSFEALRREPRAQTLLARWCGPEPLGAEARALRGGSPLALSQPGRA